ncbi:hypothetical protein ATANTOWER_003114 [Ataeniobius toweri]|uniref:Immunoglobulin V-set domain-containing protein n=1 Tax=Ataeniobius toweri TaxID=208326 RepID=A0ABU7CGN9_9TELE|nr:hypothetical protein [Ataeniobius toweri]
MSSPTQTFGLLFIWFSYQVNAANFRQSSPLIVEENSEVEITCSHDDSSLIIMLWYQHKRDTNSMTLIGYGYENSQSYEGGVFAREAVSFYRS